MFILFAWIWTFQSTLSARRATYTLFKPVLELLRFQSTLSARRATSLGLQILPTVRISIHALREESDGVTPTVPQFNKYFNPRSPRGERLHLKYFSNSLVQFQSTLSARRATFCICGGRNISNYFNPRSPRGERHFSIHSSIALFIISIHALREESDAR